MFQIGQCDLLMHENTKKKDLYEQHLYPLLNPQFLRFERVCEAKTERESSPALFLTLFLYT